MADNRTTKHSVVTLRQENKNSYYLHSCHLLGLWGRSKMTSPQFFDPPPSLVTEAIGDKLLPVNGWRKNNKSLLGMIINCFLYEKACITSNTSSVKKKSAKSD